MKKPFRLLFLFVLVTPTTSTAAGIMCTKPQQKINLKIKKALTNSHQSLIPNLTSIIL
jgi:hypothetical protein